MGRRPIHESGLRFLGTFLGQKLQGGSQKMAKSGVLPAIIGFLTQLQVVPDNEEDPSPSIIQTPHPAGEFAIKKLIDKRVHGKRTEYLVFWKGYKLADATWEYKSKIPKSFVEKYEAENGN